MFGRDWNDFYSAYVTTYLAKEIRGLISTDSITFTKFLTAAAARNGEMLNCASIASEIGVSGPTVKSWISVLERTGIICLLQPYCSAALNRSIKTPKLYFLDTGLACYLTKWLTADALRNSAVAGRMFETFVVSEILKSYSNAGRDPRFQISYYRGKDKRTTGENAIDLIIEENGALYPATIRLTDSPKASMGSANAALDKIPDKKRGMGVILCTVGQKTHLREDLIALPMEYI